jgi:glycine cleavage system H lipoate-binding protein
MVVVENGRSHVDETVTVTVTTVLQTTAGRMIFATLAEESNKPRVLRPVRAKVAQR